MKEALIVIGIALLTLIVIFMYFCLIIASRSDKQLESRRRKHERTD